MGEKRIEDSLRELINCMAHDVKIEYKSGILQCISLPCLSTGGYHYVEIVSIGQNDSKC